MRVGWPSCLFFWCTLRYSEGGVAGFSNDCSGRRGESSNWKTGRLMGFEKGIYANPSRRRPLPRASAAAAPLRSLHSGASPNDPYVSSGSALWRSLESLASVF